MAVNAVFAASNFAAAVISGSATTHSEAVYSVVDTANELLLLLGSNSPTTPARRWH